MREGEAWRWEEGGGGGKFGSNLKLSVKVAEALAQVTEMGRRGNVALRSHLLCRQKTGATGKSSETNPEIRPSAPRVERERGVERRMLPCRAVSRAQRDPVHELNQQPCLST